MSLDANLARLAHFNQHDLVFIAGKVAIGATGAVGAQTGKGFAITRTGAGAYTLTLSGRGGVAAILFAQANIVFATGTNNQYAHTLAMTASARTITFLNTDATTEDTAADPPSGSFLSFLAVVALQG